MLGVSWQTACALLLLSGLAVGAFKSPTRLALGLRPRLVTLLGGVLLVCGFFFQPWLRFDLAHYLDLGPDFVAAILPEAVEMLGPEPLARLLRLVERFTRLNGWQIQMIPFYSLETRLGTIMPVVLALAAMLWVPWGASLAGSRVCKAVGAGLLGLSLAALLVFTAALPYLDALGASHHVQWSLLAVLLGVRTGNGIWFTTAGLLMLLVGGLVEILDVGLARPPNVLAEDPW